MNNLHINVVNKVASYQKRDGAIVCGNSDYQIHFTFDSEWESYAEKTARFIVNGTFTDVDFTGNTCPVPIIRNASQIEVGVYAGDLRTTTGATIACKPSILCGSATPSSEHDEDYANEAKAAADRAEAAAEKAASYVPVDGKSAYEIAVEQGFEGDEKAWLNSLKGANGLNGVNGLDGADGKDGKNGVDGKDGKDGVDATPVTPIFVNEISDCTDTTKPYVLPDGNIYAYLKFTGYEDAYTNRANPSASEWMVGGRVGSDGTNRADVLFGHATNFISVKSGDIVRVKGGKVTTYNAGAYSSASLTSKLYVGTPTSDTSGSYFKNVSESNGITQLTIGSSASVKYVRFTVTPSDGSTAAPPDKNGIIITVNEEIKQREVSEYRWANTGHAFVPADYEDRIIVLEDDTGDHAERLDSLEMVIGALESGSDAVSIPDYWKVEADAAIARVKQLRDQCGRDTVDFIWFSDLHYGDNTAKTKHFGRVIAYVMDQLDIPLAVDCGDTVTSASLPDKETFFSYLENAMKLLAPIGDDRLLLIRGNHDDVYANSSGAVYANKLAPREAWNRLHRFQTKDFRREFGGDGTYFYIDNVPQKTRFVCLNSHFYDGEAIIDKADTSAMTGGYGATQLAWLRDIALQEGLGDGWAVVIFSHVPPFTEPVYTEQFGYVDYGAQLADSEEFLNIVNYTPAFVVGIFSGHCHLDMQDNKSVRPINTITTAGGTPYDGSGSQREVGTANEFAFDIVSLDDTDGSVYLTRVGYGSDRVYTM